MKTYLNRILAGLLAAAIPHLALAQDAQTGELPPGFVEVSDNVTSPNLRLHTVQKKEFSDAGSHEVVLYPGIVQLNTKFTQHVGFGGQYVYHLHENFALQAMAQYFYVNQQVAFADELIGSAKAQAKAATNLTLQWATTAGFEVTPIYGKFSFYEGAIGHFSVVLSGGAGMGGRRDGAGLIHPGWRLGPLEGGAGGPGGLPAVAHPVPRHGSWAAPGLTSRGQDAPTQASGMTRADGGGGGTAGVPPCAPACPQNDASTATVHSVFMAATPAPGSPRPV